MSIFFTFALNDLLKTPLYEEININICKDWKGLFAKHKQLQLENVEVPNDTSIFNFFDSDALILDDSSDEKLKCIEIDTMIHHFLDAPKIFDYENIVYNVASSKGYHPL